MNQPSSVREDPQFVSGVLTADRHVAEFSRHVDRLQDMNFHGRIDVALSGGGGRVAGMRAKGRGMTADMDVTMPDLKFGSDDDWS
jgi:hypothetical protein